MAEYEVLGVCVVVNVVVTVRNWRLWVVNLPTVQAQTNFFFYNYFVLFLFVILYNK